MEPSGKIFTFTLRVSPKDFMRKSVIYINQSSLSYSRNLKLMSFLRMGKQRKFQMQHFVPLSQCLQNIYYTKIKSERYITDSVNNLILLENI